MSQEYFVGPIETFSQQEILPVKPEEFFGKTLMYIPEGVSMETLLTFDTDMDSMTLIVVLEEDASASISLILESTAPRVELNQHVFLQEKSSATLRLLQESQSSEVHVTQQGEVAESASLRWQNITLGGEEMSHNLVTELTGPNAESSVDWVFYAKGNQKHSVSARNICNGRSGGGEMDMRGVAEDTAKVVCNGMIDIGLDGGGTNTYLTEDVLMLDSTARVDAIPGLEIKTNDVKASHSATVSQVTEEDLFYFAARGIDQDEARQMYIVGYLEDITLRIDDSAMREAVVGAIERHYEGARC